MFISSLTEEKEKKASPFFVVFIGMTVNVVKKPHEVSTEKNKR
jgi:hypothetical protein